MGGDACLVVSQVCCDVVIEVGRVGFIREEILGGSAPTTWRGGYFWLSYELARGRGSRALSPPRLARRPSSPPPSLWLKVLAVGSWLVSVVWGGSLGGPFAPLMPPGELVLNRSSPSGTTKKLRESSPRAFFDSQSSRLAPLLFSGSAGLDGLSPPGTIGE